MVATLLFSVSLVIWLIALILFMLSKTKYRHKESWIHGNTPFYLYLFGFFLWGLARLADSDYLQGVVIIMATSGLFLFDRKMTSDSRHDGASKS